ncbi:hypothetical protein RDV64_18440 [Acuticoccus sp. MNP-M23]|uniref:hypothetical protein n=1 Tax=Acuticoccus sp. MNP-M23 TaxID=3072793 RepID=UPI002815817A|nr:hypothetical protein [Acuticoccus sp. MNP-M23]WMS42027.1 hypothetical protein RDV64_18440 [Acuticoccus sp. MNP-M23]
MKRIFGGLLSAAVVAAALGTGATAARADTDKMMLMMQIGPITPNCSRNPNAPVIGRVAGVVNGFVGNSHVSFVGCFPSIADCEGWRAYAAGEVGPPLRQNSCQPRF